MWFYFLLENDILWNFLSSYSYFKMKFLKVLLLINVYFHFHFIKNFQIFLKTNQGCLKKVIAQLLYIMIFITTNYNLNETQQHRL